MWLLHGSIRKGWRFLIAALMAITILIANAQAELVLRLDASNLSTLGLSTDMTDGDIAGFPDAREVGLKFVESWGQQFGATANPALHQRLTYVGSPVLNRPTYDPDGLGTGKASVNFDYLQGDIVLGAGQRLAAGLDNFIDSPNFTTFFVGNWNEVEEPLPLYFAFGQDLDFRTGGWGMAVADGNWEGRLGGYAADPDLLGVAGASDGVTGTPGVHSLIGTAAGNLDFESRVEGAVTVNSTPRPEHGIYGAGDFLIGNRGGKDLSANSRPFDGRIGEIAIFNTELTTTERDAVRVFLENKWVGGPAPTGPQLALANSLLQPAAPTGIQNIARYEFFKEVSTDPDSTIVLPDWVATGVTASDFGSGGGLQTEEDGSVGVSNVGISARALYLGGAWSGNTVEQSPLTENPDNPGAGSPYYLNFTVTPEAGKEIDPATLEFAIARGETPAQAINGSDSYGIWIDRGNGFVKVGGEVSLGTPPASSELVPFFYQTVSADLSSVSPLTSETEFRIYFWHEGELINPDPVAQFSARIDNVRLHGLVQDIGPGGIAGDYNDNGIVDAADYVVWRNAANTNTALPNDPLGGTVDSRQYNQWRANFGMSGGSGSQMPAGAAVPEPTTLSIACLIGFLIWSGRRVQSQFA